MTWKNESQTTLTFTSLHEANADMVTFEVKCRGERGTRDGISSSVNLSSLSAIRGEREIDPHKTSWAVNRWLTFLSNIRRTRSLALSEMLGQGSESKSREPLITCSNIPFSVSAQQKRETDSSTEAVEAAEEEEKEEP